LRRSSRYSPGTIFATCSDRPVEKALNAWFTSS
jgi:hypothetical protein